MCSYCTLVAYKKSFAAKFIKSPGNDFLRKKKQFLMRLFLSIIRFFFISTLNVNLAAVVFS